MYRKIIENQSSHEKTKCSRECTLRFFKSPVEIVSSCSAGSDAKVESIRLKSNILEDYIDENAKIIATLDEPVEELKCGIVIRSIGYRSTPIDDSLPFDERRGVIRNTEGRVENNTGLYCSGWAAFGATGVILNTMNASFEVGKNILADIESGLLNSTTDKLGYGRIEPLLRQRNANVVDFIDWQRIDEYERQQGQKEGKPREKIVSVDEILSIKEQK